MYSFYNNNFQRIVLQIRKFFLNYITQVSKQVVLCVKFNLTLIKKQFVFYGETRIDRLSNLFKADELSPSLLIYVLFSCQTYNYDLNKRADIQPCSRLVLVNPRALVRIRYTIPLQLFSIIF